MRITRVRYTVKEEYVETNKRNIERVMTDLRDLNIPNLKYSSFIEEDGRTFMHFSMFKDESASDILNSLPSFTEFRKQLKASDPESPPQAEQLTLVDSAHDLFD
jgi:quinol monooxygenase YgiN